MTENSSTTAKKSQLTLIQTFRGLAAFLVVMYHANSFSHHNFQKDFLETIFEFGYAGVDFFFVLSGFIIFYAHQRDLARPNQFPVFLGKRLVRIYPVYWLVTAGVAIVNLFLPSSANNFQIGDLLTSLLLIPQPNVPIVSVGWTLRHEMLFYLIFGLGILLKPRLYQALVACWMSLSFGVFIGKLAGILSEANNYYLTDFLFNELNLEFLMGMLAAYLAVKLKKRLSFNFNVFLTFVGIFLFLLTGRLLDSPSAWRIIGYGIPSLLIVWGAALIETAKDFNAPRFLSYLGSASYSIYLTHNTFISLYGKGAILLHLETFLGHFLTLSFVTGAAIMSGCVFYSHVEDPLTQWLRKRLLIKLEGSSYNEKHKGN